MSSTTADTALTGPAPATRPGLAELLELTSPATRARQAAAVTIPVLEPLAPLLPHGGLAKGTVTEIMGDTGLLLAMAAGPAQHTPATWTACVALPDLGLAAAAGYGIDLTRVALADTPGEHWPEVVTTLAAAFQVVLLGDVGPIEPKLAARLGAHLRRTGAILLTTAVFPGAQHRLTVTHRRWDGLFSGHGQLLRRHVRVQATGRGMASTRPRTATLLLPDEHGHVAVPDVAGGLRSVPDDEGLAAVV